MFRRTFIANLVLFPFFGKIFRGKKKTYWSWVDGIDKPHTALIFLNGKRFKRVLWCDEVKGIICHIKEDKDGVMLDRDKKGNIIDYKRFYAYGNVKVVKK